MNNWQIEYTAAYNRQRVLEEVKQIRLENLALEARASCPTRFERTMLTFANWMISKGKQLRKRYDATTANCGNSPRFASQVNR